jgi:hypothetical protein
MSPSARCGPETLRLDHCRAGRPGSRYAHHKDKTIRDNYAGGTWRWEGIRRVACKVKKDPNVPIGRSSRRIALRRARLVNTGKVEREFATGWRHERISKTFATAAHPQVPEWERVYEPPLAPRPFAGWARGSSRP